MLTPETPEELAEQIVALNESGGHVIPQGGATSLLVGNEHAPGAVRLSTSAMRGVHAYQPADLTISVAAGTTISDLRSELAQHGQEIPLDVPLPEQATIGGLLATGFAGPRRLGSGSLKDILLGCTYVRGDGLLAKAGGSVVKNVSGFEIPRLLHGSWGTLAIVTSVNLKVVPSPKAECTIRFSTESLRSAREIWPRIRQDYPSVAALTCEIQGDQIWLLVRLMGRPGAVQTQTRQLMDAFGTSEIMKDEESRNFWQQHVDRLALPDAHVVQLVTGTRPRDVLEQVTEICTALSVTSGATLSVSPALGSARVQFAASQVEAADFWNIVRSYESDAHTKLYVEFAPDSWKQHLNVWGDPVNPNTLMQKIKFEFDPERVLNRNRLFI